VTDSLVTVYALSEDSASDAHDVLSLVVRASLRIDAPNTPLDRVRFEPTTEGHAAVKANRWKSTAANDHRRRVDLLRTLATQICRSNCLVVFHFDGDTTWQDRALSENQRKFHDVVVLGVKRVLHDKGIDASRIEEVLRRLVAFVPHYTMESWLYQSTEAAVALCLKHGNQRDVETFGEWERDRTVLDEIVQPWKVVSIGKNHNRVLAEAFPARAVYEIGKSYAASVDRLREHGFVMQALEWVANDGARRPLVPS
jgi:hypothetical protein